MDLPKRRDLTKGLHLRLARKDVRLESDSKILDLRDLRIETGTETLGTGLELVSNDLCLGLDLS